MEPLIEVRLGESFLDTLVDESYVVVVLPLDEIASSSAEDHAAGLQGTYVGTGLVRGVDLGFPDPILGTQFDGNQYVEIDPPQDLHSLAGGSMDLAFIISTTHNSVVGRAIISKQDTNSTGNGYHVALVGGKIQFYLRVTGTTIFNFQRGLPGSDAVISDGVVRVVHCFYDPATAAAWIEFDGVQSGATVTGVTTDPALTTAPFRVGAFSNGVAGDGAGFIGVLAMVMAGREGNPGLGTELAATQVWTDITADVRAAGQAVQMRRGISGWRPTDLMAGAGLLSFTLNNLNPLGKYTPGHDNQVAGWQKGCPVRFSLIDTGSVDPVRQFVGWVKSIRPDAWVHGPRAVTVTCTDWLYEAATQLLTGVATQINQRSDIVFAIVVDAARRPPHAINFTLGSQEFPYSLDSTQLDTPILQELTRIQVSEPAHAYVLGDGTLRKEGRATRQTDVVIDATFDNTMQGLEVLDDVDDIINVMKMGMTPREVGMDTDTELFRSGDWQIINPDSTLTLEGNYTDPEQRAASVGGMEESVETTFTASTEGAGADLSAQLTVTFTPSGSGFTLTAYNSGGTAGYLFIIITGRIIRHFSPETHPVVDNRSRRRFGERSMVFDQPYQVSADDSVAIGQFFMQQLREGVRVPRGMKIHGNRSAALMTQAIVRDIGDKVAIAESMTAIRTTDPDTAVPIGYYIQEVEKSVSVGQVPIIEAVFRLAPSPDSSHRLCLLDTVGFAELDAVGLGV